MNEDINPWQKRFERERKSRKESESLLEQKSIELWNINQNLEKEVAQRTKSLEDALLKAEKADRAKSDFLANISHEIRTPLNALMGFSQFLSTSNDLSDKNKNYASIIQTSASSLLEIINDILDFSKIESGNFEISDDDFEIYSLCKNVRDMFYTKIEEKNLSFEFYYDNEIPKYIHSDDVRIKQVLSNLLSNAVKFTDKNGKISFRTSLIKKDYSIAQIKFEVKDSGIGIPEDRLQIIFKPFTQLQNISNKKYKGTGLGLSICNNILKFMNSKLEVESDINKGTRFSFILNVDISSNKEIQKLKDQSVIEEQITFHGAKVLLAEDHVANQELMKLVFSEIGLTFDLAVDGKEAYELYVKNNNSYDIVFMDVNMPKLNGVQALFMIREYEKINSLDKTPVVALTANAIKGDEERFLSLGMDEYLSKPINTNKLKTIISKYIESSVKSHIEIGLSTIAKKLGVSENIANLLLNKFKEEIVQDMSELNSFIYEKDRANIVSKAHYIKNSCLNICLDEACELLEMIEYKELPFTKIEELYFKLDNLIKSIK